VVDRQTLQRLAPSVDLIPGMPMEVLVVTERRTMVEYLASRSARRFGEASVKVKNGL
jgi:hypothetical protein